MNKHIFKRTSKKIIVFNHKVSLWDNIFNQFTTPVNQHNKKYFYKIEDCKDFNDFDSTRRLKLKTHTLFNLLSKISETSIPDCESFLTALESTTFNSYSMDQDEYSLIINQAKTIVFLGNKNAPPSFNKINEISNYINKKKINSNTLDKLFLLSIANFGIHGYINIQEKNMAPTNFNEKILFDFLRIGALKTENTLIHINNYNLDYIKEKIQKSSFTNKRITTINNIIPLNTLNFSIKKFIPEHTTNEDASFNDFTHYFSLVEFIEKNSKTLLSEETINNEFNQHPIRNLALKKEFINFLKIQKNNNNIQTIMKVHLENELLPKQPTQKIKI